MSQRFIASARFLAPEPPPALVVRPHLVERLSLMAAPTTLIVGAPGAGKTAVVGQWVRQRSAPTAWLSCDPTDEDPVRFWAALALAIQRIVPGAGVDALKRLDEDGCESVDMAANLASDCEFAEGLVIVVDDFHHAGPSAAAFSAFVRSLPAGVRIVLVSRHDPGFPVGRLRVQGRLLEIRDADLRFTTDEAAELLARAGSEVSELDLARLCDLTEGWAAGLQLAALALAARPDVAELMRSFAASDRGVTDFLVNEVIDAQPPEIADFMMRTSVMDSFDATLCDAVTDRDDSAELLRQLHRNNLFVIALDRRAGWFRYHHLFGAFLQARLLATSRQRHRQAHAAASLACSSRGDMMSAVRHAMAADDLDRALELVRAVTTTTFDLEAIQAGVDTVRAWLRTHGERYLESDPSVVLECCIVLAAVVATADAEMWMRRVEQRYGSLEVADAALLACAQGLLAVNHGDADTALARIEDAQRVVGDDLGAHFWVSQSPIVTCHAHLLRGDVAATRRAIADARATSMPSAFVDAARFPGMLAWAAVLAGELTEATRQSGFAISTMQSMGLDDGNIAWVLPRLSLAAVAREQDDVSAAAELLDAVMPIAERGRRPPLILLATMERARVAVALGDTGGGRAALDEARGILPTATPEVIDQIDRHVARIAVDERDPRATVLVDALRPSVHRTLLRARLAIAEGEASAACELLGTIDDDEVLRVRVERGLLAARALEGLGDRTAALATLDGALRLAEPVGLRRPVVEDGPELDALLSALPTDGRIGPFVDSVLDGARRRPAPVGPGATRPLVDTLSDREVEVLRYLASRLTYGEIAGQLYISVNTLKSHVKAVYRKLGVATRAEAMTEGRRAGLL